MKWQTSNNNTKYMENINNTKLETGVTTAILRIKLSIFIHFLTFYFFGSFLLFFYFFFEFVLFFTVLTFKS